jgi:hypothetical protein
MTGKNMNSFWNDYLGQNSRIRSEPFGQKVKTSVPKADELL